MGSDSYKPCPFCGSPHVSMDDTDEVFRHIDCETCGARGPTAGDEDPASEESIDHNARLLAAERWNAAPRRRVSR